MDTHECSTRFANKILASEMHFNALRSLTQPCLTAYYIGYNIPMIQALYQALQISVSLGKCIWDPIHQGNKLQGASLGTCVRSIKETNHKVLKPLPWQGCCIGEHLTDIMLSSIAKFIVSSAYDCASSNNRMPNTSRWIKNTYSCNPQIVFTFCVKPMWESWQLAYLKLTFGTITPQAQVRQVH